MVYKIEIKFFQYVVGNDLQNQGVSFPLSRHAVQKINITRYPNGKRLNHY